MAEGKKEAAEEKAAAKPKLNLLENKAVVLGAIVVVQALVAVALTQFVIVPRLGVQAADAGGQAAIEAEEKAAEAPQLGVLVDLKEIIVTLAGESARPRYLRISVSLEVKDQVTATVVGGRLAQLRDIVIMVLSDKTAEVLTTPDGKKGLRDEIFRRVAEKMPEGTLMNVYFSDLVVQ